MIRRGLLATWTIAVLMTALLVVPQPARAGAARWTSEGPYGLSITAMAVDPVDDDVVYAEAANVGIVKSTDAGRTWTPTGFEPYLRVVIAVDAVDHDIVYVTDEQRFWASEDGGATWKVRFRRGLWPSRLAVDPALEGVLYAFDGSQLQQTTDGGFHWSPVVGEPCDSDVCYVGNQVAVDPSEPGTVIASV
ncbi:MAG TPA: hypothetical protein VNN79_02255, partial [Actinomycetota bacterium]|nr:hypothetical protein [Actinomycetota bacterium]